MFVNCKDTIYFEIFKKYNHRRNNREGLKYYYGRPLGIVDEENDPNQNL